MIEILEMSAQEVDAVLQRVGFGHLGCSLNDQPYVVPINYVYNQPTIYLYTTAGMKSEIIKKNPLVCLQVEETLDEGGWRSVVVTGEAHQLVDRSEREQAVKMIREVNPSLLPALALKWRNDWIQKNVEVVYRIDVHKATGLMTSEVQVASASVRPAINA